MYTEVQGEEEEVPVTVPVWRYFEPASHFCYFPLQTVVYGIAIWAFCLGINQVLRTMSNSLSPYFKDDTKSEVPIIVSMMMSVPALFVSLIPFFIAFEAWQAASDVDIEAGRRASRWTKAWIFLNTVPLIVLAVVVEWAGLHAPTDSNALIIVAGFFALMVVFSLLLALPAVFVLDSYVARLMMKDHRQVIYGSRGPQPQAFESRFSNAFLSNV